MLALTLWAGACNEEPPPDVLAHARDSAARVAASSAMVAAAATARRLPQICTDTTETAALRCANGRVERRGDTLAISLLEGSTIVRVDARGDGDGEGLVEYRYMGRLRGANGGPSFHILEALGFESAGVQLVNARTGDSVGVSGFPVPSPDGARFATAPLGRDDCESENDLELWRLADDKPAREWSLVLDDCTGTGGYATELAWRSPDTLSLLRERTSVDGSHRARRERGAARDTVRVHVVHGPRGWTLANPG
jgi:hypothetical protein